MLEIRNISKSFEGVRALDAVEFSVTSGEFVSLIGPNGSGKTTLFNCITGFLSPDEGHVLFEGRELVGAAPYAISQYGIARTFQSVRLFGKLSVLDNLLVSVQEHQAERSVARVLRSRAVRGHEREARRRAEVLVDRIGLGGFLEKPARELSYGQRKLLSIGMALVAQPRLLLLDEPTAAVNPTLILTISDLLRELMAQGQTFLVVEHNMEFVMSLSHRVVVLDAGRKIAEGSPESVRSDARVLEAYLGG